MPTLLIYGVVALGILGVLGGIGWKVRQAGADSVRAELQPKIAACEGQIATQNSAIEALRQEQARKQAEASQALRKAEGRAKVWDDQSKRLTAALAGRKPTDDQSCAGAWTEIRKP